MTLAAGLAQKLDDIDAVCATKRRQLARAPVQLPWPARNTVVILERAQATVDSALADLQGGINSGQTSPEEWALMESVWEDAMAMAEQAARDRNAAKLALSEARDTATDACDAVEAEERATAPVRAAEAAEAAAAAATKAATDAAAAFELAQAQLAELELAHSRTRSQLAHAERERIAPVAEQVWGPLWRSAASTPPPRVISLVGKSPESIRTIGESRVISQQITSAEKRIAIDRGLGAMPPMERMIW